MPALGSVKAVTKFDWNNEMTLIETRLDDHLTDEETATRLAEIDRLTAPLHRRKWRSFVGETYAEAIFGLVGSGVIALLTVLAFVVLL